MSYIELAIKDAVEKGGYGYKNNLDFYLKLPDYAKSQIWLDPEFWKALGKARGWRQSYTKDDPEWRTMTIEQMQENTPLAHWRRFVEWLYEGRDAESFFESLSDKV